MITAAEAVAQGAQLLDEKKPGWWRIINLDTLDLTLCDACVCGQLARATYDRVKLAQIMSDPNQKFYNQSYSTYWNFVREDLGLRNDVDHGFSVSWDDDEDDELAAWQALDEEWRKVIRARLEADKLAQEELDALTQEGIDEIAELTGVHL